MKKKIVHLLLLVILCITSLFWDVISVFAIEKNIKDVNVVANGDLIQAHEKISMVESLLSSRMFDFSYAGLKIFIDTNQREPRGQIRWKEMKLSAILASDGEFLKLLTHELGHFIDIYVLRKSNNQPDPSIDFYKISWQSPKTKHAWSSLVDFVSWYASTNQYEDFSESLVWYVFHNEDFMARAMKNESLRKKYLFFADHVFVHWEFQGTDFSIGMPSEYNWDTTKVPILLQKYLSFLIS